MTSPAPRPAMAGFRLPLAALLSGIGKALLELHGTLEPQRALARVEKKEERRIGDGRPELPLNVIPVDFVGRRRR